MKKDMNRARKVLGKFHGLIAVSRAIPTEMGNGWKSKVISLDPGVALDEKDLDMINEIISKNREKADYIIFGGRPSPFKGLIECILTFKRLCKEYPKLKLYITGHVDTYTKNGIKKIIRKLGIENKVMLTGFVSRKERLKIVARAKLMLYPSHRDSYSYAVLESLMLKTPVVGYDIPALRIYFGNLKGVKLVRELDIEALTIEAMNMLNKRQWKEIEKPRTYKWRKIMEEPVDFIFAVKRKDYLHAIDEMEGILVEDGTVRIKTASYIDAYALFWKCYMKMLFGLH